jgi:glycosyltransferase involved in cell wall biosynthesis
VRDVREEPRRELTIGIVFPGDARDSSALSGVPAGLARGFEEAGARVVHLSAELPPVIGPVLWNLIALARLHRTWSGSVRETVRLSRRVANSGPELAFARSSVAAARVRRARELDAIVQIGTGYSIPAIAPIATFEDMTVRQCVEFGYPHWQALSARAVEARIERQRRAYAQAAACCTRTRWAATSVVRDYGVPAEKVHVVGVGRNRDPAPTERDWGRPRFLFVGKEWERKNGPGVLRAFTRLRKVVPEAGLDVVGGHPPLDVAGVTGHGILRPDIAAERRRLDALFGAATCFVMPSFHEPAGIVYVEAGAAGIASIGTARGGAAELIDGAGRVVDPHDEDALLAAMLELSEPAVAERLGAAAWERSALFTWHAVAERILRALRLSGGAIDSLAPRPSERPVSRP